MNLPDLAQLLFNTPLAIHPKKAEVVMVGLTDRFGITQIQSRMIIGEEDDYFSRKAPQDTGYEVLWTG
ncbi:hypothetical protein [Arsenophonus endosymbiont of Bemisia tabaci]|uniref:hypothetical protein n=1 Tax=Arsenophonus endosymbiont of Bemisia tabaci TaxID=536059 RepID=UPI0017538B1C|nr:hypothetical protein [Arsenophonus endosymbiont of Bemisia tabaci]CAA2928999.1 hypothetical protein ARSQ2_00060 [Arsenophonus endosymbiont of Bemisia tabaci Q2]